MQFPETEQEGPEKQAAPATDNIEPNEARPLKEEDDPTATRLALHVPSTLTSSEERLPFICVLPNDEHQLPILSDPRRERELPSSEGQ